MTFRHARSLLDLLRRERWVAGIAGAGLAGTSLGIVLALLVLGGHGGGVSDGEVLGEVRATTQPESATATETAMAMATGSSSTPAGLVSTQDDQAPSPTSQPTPAAAQLPPPMPTQPASTPAPTPPPPAATQSAPTPSPTPNPLLTLPSVYWIDARGAAVGFIYYPDLSCIEKAYPYGGFDINCTALTAGWTIDCTYSENNLMSCTHSQDGTFECSWNGTTYCIASDWVGQCGMQSESVYACQRTDMNGNESVTCTWSAPTPGGTATCSWLGVMSFQCQRTTAGSGVEYFTCKTI